MHIRLIKLPVILIAPIIAVALSSCETVSKQQMGAVLGATAGAVIGNQFGGNSKILWTAVGGAAGGLIGNQLGQYLDERDRQRMAEVTEQTIATGQTRTWSNPQKNTRGEARVIDTQTKSEPVNVRVLKKKISQVPPLDIMGQTYRATKKANLRGGPGTDYETVGTLAPKEVVNVVGKVRDSDWYLISQNGVGSGFISTALLEAAPNESPVASGQPIAESDVAEEQVASNRICRKIQQTVSLPDGSSHTETIDACQSPTGWEVKT